MLTNPVVRREAVPGGLIFIFGCNLIGVFFDSDLIELIEIFQRVLFVFHKCEEKYIDILE